jgi:hypothetical protein
MSLSVQSLAVCSREFRIAVEKFATPSTQDKDFTHVLSDLYHGLLSQA